MNSLTTEAPALPKAMQAARLHARGGPDQIVIEMTTLPTMGPKDALVAVRAAAITPSELGWVPTWTHTDGTDRTPSIPAHEVAGIVAATGSDVRDLLVGTAVFGLTDFFRDGGAAEYVAVNAADLAVWPNGIDEASAAALALSGLTAWQALFDHGNLVSGQRVLIHGAAGGVGSFVVQLAHWRKAHVIAVGSRRDFDFLRELGSDQVVDPDAERFDELVADIDLVIDTIGGETLERSWAVLAPRGRIVSIAPSSREIASRDARCRFFVVAPNRDQLRQLAGLVESGELRAIVEWTFPLDQTRRAYEFAQAEHPRGKIVLRIANAWPMGLETHRGHPNLELPKSAKEKLQ